MATVRGNVLALLDEFEHETPVRLNNEMNAAVVEAVAAERQACAKIAESFIDPDWPSDDLSAQASNIAAAIRERGEAK